MRTFVMLITMVILDWKQVPIAPWPYMILIAIAMIALVAQDVKELTSK